MLRGLASKCVFAAFFLGDAARMDGHQRHAVVTVECILEWVSAIAAQPGTTAALKDNALQEFVDCTTTNGAKYSLDPRDVQGFEDHDLISLTVGEATGTTALGTQVFQVISAELLRHEQIGDDVRQQSSGFTALLIGTNWTDGKASDPQSTIMSNWETTRKLIIDASYDTHHISGQYTMTQMPQSWSDAVQNCHQARLDILSRTPNSDAYVYRMIFLPASNPHCGGWAGVASGGCSPSSPPSAGKCWSMYQGGKWMHGDTMGHELGHNFGLGHNGALVNGEAGTVEWNDYGDGKAIMGNIVFCRGCRRVYSAPERVTVGWLQEANGELMTRSKGRYTLSSLAKPKRYPGSDCVAIRILCEVCEPQRADHNASGIRGDLIVSFADGQVYVHLRKGGPGNERWAQLSSGEVWKNEFQSNVVQVCSISGDYAYVGISDTPTGAEAECGGYYVASDSSRNCAIGERILSSVDCQKAGQVLGYPFQKDVSTNKRPAGCFADPNGKSYFNSQQPSAPTWAHGICQSS